MKRALVLLLLFAACEKPTEDSCRQALANMRDLLGTDNALGAGDIESSVRRCKGGSSKKAVDCAAKAKSLDELEKCEFMKMPDKEERCKKAIANVRALRGGSGAAPAQPTADELHACARSSRHAIECAVKAENAEALGKCGIVGVAGAEPTNGSAAPSSGSGSGK